MAAHPLARRYHRPVNLETDLFRPEREQTGISTSTGSMYGYFVDKFVDQSVCIYQKVVFGCITKFRMLQYAWLRLSNV